MCGSSEVTSPDTSAATAEQQRQFDASNQLAQEQLAQQNAQFQAQQKAASDQQKAQLAASQTAAQQQQAAQAAALAQQQSQFAGVQALQQQEDDAKTAAAQKDATDQQAYATGRQNLASQYTKQVNDQYAGFDDDYFNQFAQKLVDTYAPQVAQSYGDAQQSTKASFNDAGTLDSSGAAKSFATLAAQDTSANASLASSAQDQAQTLKSNVNAQKSSTLGALMGSLATANSLPAGGDPTQALQSLNSNLGATYSAAGTPTFNTTSSYTPPAFSVATPPRRTAQVNTYATGLG